MKPAIAGDAPYRVPRDNRRWPALALAVAMHAGLLAALWVSVQWQNSEPVAVEAEVWDMKTEAAAPPPAPQPEPEPEPAEAPPEAAPPAPKLAQAEPEAPAAPSEAEIALERRKLLKAKKEKEAAELKHRLEEKRAQEKADQAIAEAKAKADAKLKAEKDKAKAEAQAKADKADKAKADAKAKAEAEAKAEAKAKTDKDLAAKNADKAAKAKRDAAEQKAADDARRAEMSRITGAAGNGALGSTGTAAKSTGPGTDKSYIAAIAGKIKSNIAYSGGMDVAGNPRAEFRIDQLPTGEIISVKKLKGSGIPAYDTAVENAITKSSPLPKKKDGTVDRELQIGFNLKDTH